MLTLRRPSDADIAAFLDRQSRGALSYAGVGATRSDPPSGYNVDHNRIRLGTLADHVESGEERFSVEWRRQDGSVWYDLLAFSRPRHPLAKLGTPMGRALQRRFARDSLQAMARAVVHEA